MISLKYRIALTIFALEACMVALVLWQTLGASFSRTALQFEQNDTVILELLGEMAKVALLTQEYDDLQTLFDHAENDSRIAEICLLNNEGIMVLGNNFCVVGQEIPPQISNETLFWRSNEISGASGIIGEITIQFSNAPLANIIDEARKRGVFFAIIAMLFIALVGLGLGFALSRRLETLASFADNVANGEYSGEFPTQGRDEVARVGQSLNTMLKVIRGNQRELKLQLAEYTQTKIEMTTLETHIQQLQKMETIGTLAAGIAHDFNNILSPIIGYAEMAIEDLPASDPLQSNLIQISNAAKRATKLVNQILLFSRQSKPEKNQLAIQSVITEALKLLRATIPSTIEIRQDIDSNCEKVLADATQIHQVIMNLCTNAWQAMEQDGGKLSIELKQVEIDSVDEEKDPRIRQGKHVRLTVTDTGIGMDKNIVQHMFDPFFTTKPVDQGTGMGLSVVHGIVHDHGGEIIVHSEPGTGTRIQVYLPVMVISAPPVKTVTDNIPSGDESIMIVDDEVEITEMLRLMLSKIGYTIDTYNNSTDALESFKRSPEKYDLLISDLTMPGLTGLDLVHEVEKIRPGFPTVIITGYAGLNDQGLPTPQSVLQKPLSIMSVAVCIRKVLDNAYA